MVVELAPALLLLIMMHPVANRAGRPKFSLEFALLAPNNTEDLLVGNNHLRTATTYGELLMAANDPKTRI